VILKHLIYSLCLHEFSSFVPSSVIEFLVSGSAHQEISNEIMIMPITDARITMGLLILTLFYLQSLTQYNPSGLPGVEGNAGQLSRGQVKQAVS
jgi:hypothetical protein